MPKVILGLNEDALVQVLMALPRFDDWVFVALTCKALRSAAVEAFERMQTEALAAGRLPGASSGLRASHFKPVCTHARSAMASPRRFVFVKKQMRHAPHFCEGYVPVLTAASQSARDTGGAVARRHREFFAASNLSTRAIYHLLEQAPLSMIRACFFDVLGGVSGCHFDFNKRDHRALLAFASRFGRTDVLDWLVHSNPHRAKACDFDRGLLQLFDLPMVHALCGWNPRSSWTNQQRVNQRRFESFLVVPAYMSNSAATLDWLDFTISAIADRRGVRIRDCTLNADFGHEWLMSRCCFMGVTVDTFSDFPSFGDHEMCMHSAFKEAATAGATEVLEHVFAYAMKVIGQNYRPCKDFLDYGVSRSGFGTLVVFSLFLCVLSTPGNGASMRWLQKKCKDHAGCLTRLACLRPSHTTVGFADGHEFQFADHSTGATFDMEDLVFVFNSADSWYSRVMTEELIKFDVMPVVRNNLVAPGDVEYNQWLLQQFEYPPPPTDALGNWFARSLPKLQLQASMVFTTMNPNDWDTRNGVCRHLLRKGEKLRQIMCKCEFGDDQAPAHIYWNRLTERRPWLPNEAMQGPSRLEDGLAFVLGQWMIHVLAHGPKDATETHLIDPWHRYREAWDDWRTALLTFPAACLGPVDDACRFLLALDVWHKRDIRRILEQLLACVCVPLMHAPHADDREVPPRRKCLFAGDWLCSFAYVELMCKHNLMTNTHAKAFLDDTRPSVLAQPGSDVCELHKGLSSLLKTAGFTVER